MRDDCAILIPSLQPDERLVTYVSQLSERGFRVFVVNDGSSKEYDGIFESVSKIEGTCVLRHEVNRGKGAALRTGIKEISEKMPLSGVVTADSDGQHAVNDIEKLADMLKTRSGVLFLGARDFTLPNIPKKSRVGNRTTSRVFKLLYSTELQDTQTGLRAFSSDLIPLMLSIKGDRFEYEMNVLSRCALSKIPMISVPIETIYEQGKNESTHFRAVRDSLRIYGTLFSTFLKYVSSSVVCMLIDVGAQGLFEYVLNTLMNVSVLILGYKIQVAVAALLARALSAVVNYTLNRKLVFGTKGGSKSASRYAVLCVCSFIASVVLLLVCDKLLKLSDSDVGWRMLIKLPVNFVIFIANYQIQRAWVFRSDIK